MTNEKIIEVKVVTRLQDNGDGGYTTYVYNNEDELITNHPKATNYQENPDTGVWGYVTVEITQELRNKILNEDDPYENGYIGSETIKIKINNDGTISLAEPISFHSGQ